MLVCNECFRGVNLALTLSSNCDCLMLRRVACLPRVTDMNPRKLVFGVRLETGNAVDEANFHYVQRYFCM